MSVLMHPHFVQCLSGRHFKQKESMISEEEEVTHRYLKDFLSVIEHLNPYGDLASWRLARWAQARL